MTTRRRTIDVPGLRHGELPIPVATRIDNLIFSSGIHGLDPDTQTVPTDAKLQVELVFRHMRSIVEAGGGTVDDIAFVLFNLKGDEYRSLVHSEWLTMFPSGDRPARNTQIVELGMGMVIHACMTAVLDPSLSTSS